MIITCEQCNARYLLASLLLGTTGRTVRCGVCGHSWFQEPEEEAFTREAADDVTFADMVRDTMDPIPEGVRPIPEGSGIPALHGGSKIPISKRGVAGAIAALFVFILVSGLVMILREPIARAWPPAALLYEMAGMPVAIPGEGLIFDGVKAVSIPAQDGTYSLTVTGTIINLRRQDAALPKIEAALLREGGGEIESWTVPVDSRAIDGEEVIPFSVTYDGLAEADGEVNIRFVQN